MKHRNRNLALWLCSCFLLPHSVARAQISFLAALSRPANVVGQTARPNATSPITVPAGTHLLMKLTCPLHTTSATAGSGVHLETSSPVIADDRIAIPEKTHVFGVGEKNRRPGRMHGRARLRMRFTQFILPDDRVLAISGNLQSLPGSAEHRTTDEQGTLEPVDQIDGDVYTVASTTGLGVLIGSIGHIGIGVGPGAAIGFGLGLAKVLFTRGDAISLRTGTEIEMVLQRPLIVETHSTETMSTEAHYESTHEETDPLVSALGNPARIGRNGTDVRCSICE